MSIINQIKLANAGRRMYNKMCNRCRIRLTQEFANDYKRQQATNETHLGPQETIERTKKILCSRCQKVFEEAMENR